MNGKKKLFKVITIRLGLFICTNTSQKKKRKCWFYVHIFMEKLDSRDEDERWYFKVEDLDTIFFFWDWIEEK